MLKAKRKPTTYRPLSDDEIEDLWLVVEDAADADDARLLRAGYDALRELYTDIERKRA